VRSVCRVLSRTTNKMSEREEGTGDSRMAEHHIYGGRRGEERSWGGYELYELYTDRR